ncbi:MAG TPA: protein kinase [Candidatus Acidoferrales bacterium]|jgi:serine/threonine protein kinase|nr:protein kinase [Candidatus Acidoferrales bacterium]
MPLAPGTKFGPYEILAPLGAGGMGEVYRARDTRLGRDVAIKVLPAGFAQDADRLRRFETEARTIATLNHPNILSIHDIGTHDGAPFLVSECLEGHSLRQELSTGALPLRRSVEYGTQIAQGLAAAHDKGIIHRDLKPENVFVTQDGRVKILDFGLAKLAKPEASSDEEATLGAASQDTSPGMVLGTVGYMSPEQVRGEPADARSDIFALGAILYEMLSGRRAFRRGTSAETMTAILKEDPGDLSVSTKPIAPALERTVRRCLEKKPLQRFQSARDLAFDLEGISGISTTTSASAAAPGPQPRKWLLPLAAGALLLVLGGLAGWLLHRGGSAALPLYHQLTFERGLIYAARFSPDGRSIYYSASWNGQPVQLYSTAPDSPESRPLNLPNSTLFSVSPSELAISLGCKDMFIGNCQGTLATVPVSGGAPREIAEDAVSADWTADGSALAVVRQVAGKYRVEFPRGNVIYESSHALRYVRISPRADHVAFGEFLAIDGDGGWAVILDRSGKQIARSPIYVSLEGLAWPPSGDEVWFGATAHEGWADAVHALRLDGRDRIVLRLAGILRLHDVSRDGRILFTRESWRSGLQFRGPADAKERDLSWLDYAQLKDLSLDGSQVAFDDWGAAAGSASLAFLRNTDGSPAVKLGTWVSPVLSPDGKRVLALDAANVGLSHPLTLLPVGVGETQKLPVGPIGQQFSWGWMPDGKAIYFIGDDGQGRRVYLQDLAGGAPRAVTPLISAKPSHFETQLVSPDGKFIFARDVDGKGQLYPLAGGEPQAVPGWLPEDIWITWSADGRSAYVFHDEKTSAPVYRLDVATGKRQLVMTLIVGDPAGATAISAVRMTPDGKAYAYSYSRDMSDLFLVEGVR